SRHAFAVLRGLAIAIPLLLIFGALFMAADAAFEGLVNRTFNFDVDTLVSHFLLTAFLAWLTAGYFRGSIIKPFSPIPTGAATNPTGAMGVPPTNETGAVGVPPTTDPVTPEAETRPVGGVSESDDVTSFVAKVAAEPGESGA